MAGSNDEKFDKLVEELHPYYMSLEDDHPLLADVNELDEDNEIVMALKHIDDEGTIEEQAENLKIKGNTEFKLNKYRWDKAIEYYDQAIKLGSSNQKAVSVYYANRAAVNFALGNWRKVIDDCVEAVRLDPTNIKAHWRAAKSANNIGKYKYAIQYADAGLKVDPKNAPLMKEKANAEQKMKEKLLKKQKMIEARQAAAQHTTEKNTELLTELAKRGIVMSKPQFDMQRQYEGEIRVDDQGELHWPVMFLYDETSQSEFVRDFNENHTFQDHLSYMFPPDYTAPWDRDGKYKLETMEIYFVAHGSAPLPVHRDVYQKRLEKTDGSTKRRWIKVRLTTTLKTVLTHPACVVPGLPVFHIVANPSSFRDVFLRKEFERDLEYA